MNNTHDENESEPVYNEVENPIPEMTNSLTKKRIFTPKESLLLDRSMRILLWMLFPVMLTNLILIVGTFSIPGNNLLYLFSEYHIDHLLGLTLPISFFYSLHFVVSIVCGIVMLRLSSIERKYCVSGILYIIRALFFIIALITTLIVTWYSTGIVVRCLFLCLIMRYISYSFEFAGHSSVLQDLDNELSKDWTNLKKWMTRFLLVIPSVPGIFLIRGFLEKEFPLYFSHGYDQSAGFITSILFILESILFLFLILALIVSIIGLAGVSVVKYVFLSQTVTDLNSYRKDPDHFDPSKLWKNRQGEKVEEILAANDFQNLMSGDKDNEQ